MQVVYPAQGGGANLRQELLKTAERKVAAAFPRAAAAAAGLSYGTVLWSVESRSSSDRTTFPRHGGPCASSCGGRSLCFHSSMTSRIRIAHILGLNFKLKTNRIHRSTSSSGVLGILDLLRISVSKLNNRVRPASVASGPLGEVSRSRRGEAQAQLEALEGGGIRSDDCLQCRPRVRCSPVLLQLGERRLWLLIHLNPEGLDPGPRRDAIFGQGAQACLASHTSDPRASSLNISHPADKSSFPQSVGNRGRV